jgi:hypothetical protein
MAIGDEADVLLRPGTDGEVTVQVWRDPLVHAGA